MLLEEYNKKREEFDKEQNCEEYRMYKRFIDEYAKWWIKNYESATDNYDLSNMLGFLLADLRAYWVSWNYDYIRPETQIDVLEKNAWTVWYWCKFLLNQQNLLEYKNIVLVMFANNAERTLKVRRASHTNWNEIEDYVLFTGKIFEKRNGQSWTPRFCVEREPCLKKYLPANYEQVFDDMDAGRLKQPNLKYYEFISDIFKNEIKRKP